MKIAILINKIFLWESNASIPKKISSNDLEKVINILYLFSANVNLTSG